MDIEISLETSVEEIVEQFPEAVGFLSRHGVRCIRCGEPLWCTLGELLREDDIENPQRLLEELIGDLMRNKSKTEPRNK